MCNLSFIIIFYTIATKKKKKKKKKKNGVERSSASLNLFHSILLELQSFHSTSWIQKCFPMQGQDSFRKCTPIDLLSHKI